MNSVIVFALATCAIAAEVPKYIKEVKSTDVADDCKFISEEEFKKLSAPDSAEAAAVRQKCVKACTGLDVLTKDSTPEQTKASAEQYKKIAAEMAEKCKEPADKTAECMAKAQKEAKMCMTSCGVCTNHSSASTLILGAAAVATAMLLI
jgi:hypothetical protein